MAEKLFVERIKDVMRELHVKNNVFAEVGGITRQTLSGYLNTANEPSRVTLTRWVKAYGINAEWLLTGEGPMFRDQIQTLADPIAQRVEAVGRAMRESGAAEADILRAIRAMIDGEIAKAGQATEPDPAPSAGSASA